MNTCLLCLILAAQLGNLVFVWRRWGSQVEKWNGTHCPRCSTRIAR